MKYYLDTEFNGFGGELLSLALVREDNFSLYIIYEFNGTSYEPWVKENVVPIMYAIPGIPRLWFKEIDNLTGANAIRAFLQDDKTPHIISDWPDDIRYFCQSIITGPGMMVSIPQLDFSIRRVDAYPTTLENAVQHNALWDAYALKTLLEGRP